MPEYTVQNTHIKHGDKGSKEAVIYAPGETISLSEKEARALGANVVLSSPSDSKTPESDLLQAAVTAIEGGRVTQDGRPEVKAMEEILGRNITADERDMAWGRIIKPEKE